MSGIPFWDDAPEVWDAVILGNYNLPGVCDVKEPSLEEAVDTKKPVGGAGAVTTFQGPMPVAFDIVLTLHTRQHWDDFQALAPLIRPKAGKGQRIAYDISHPKVNVWGVTSVLITKMKGPQQGSVKGTYMVTLSCQEFTAIPKSSTSTPKKSQAVSNLYDNKMAKRDDAFHANNKDFVGPPGPPGPKDDPAYVAP